MSNRKEKATSKDFRKKIRRLDNRMSEWRQLVTDQAKNVCRSAPRNFVLFSSFSLVSFVGPSLSGFSVSRHLGSS